MIDIIQGDALESLQDLPSESVSLVVTDPPYAALDEHRAIGTTTRLAGGWFPTMPVEGIVAVLRECARVLKKNSHMYVFANSAAMWELKPAIEAATGLRFWKALVWDKECMGMGYHYRATYEVVLFFEKGKRKLNNLGVPDVLHHRRLRGKALYPTTKPVGLFKTLITQSSDPGDLVLDPFCGSGSSGVAAMECHRSYLGVDIEVDAVTRARDRITP